MCGEVCGLGGVSVCGEVCGLGEVSVCGEVCVLGGVSVCGEVCGLGRVSVWGGQGVWCTWIGLDPLRMLDGVGGLVKLFGWI